MTQCLNERCSRLCSTLSLLAVSGSLQAAGFQIVEQSVTGLGRGFAGSGVVADDASVAFYNPAGMTLLDGQTAQIGAIYIGASGHFSNDGSSRNFPTSTGSRVSIPASGPNDDGSLDALVPNLFYVSEINPNLRVGLGITAPFGLATEYDDDWVGRYHALESALTTIDINPSVAYRISDQFSVGFGLSAQYAEATLSRAIFTGPGNPDGFAEVTGDNWGFGYNIGVMFEPDDTTRFGLHYRSHVNQTLNGSREVDLPGGGLPDVDAKASVDLPEYIDLSAYKELNDQWAVMATARWTRWSRFDELRIEFEDGSPDDVTEENWDNSWAFRLGASYRPNRQWTFRAGYVFDQSPIPNSEFRTPRIPDSDRNWLTLGASYRPSDNLSVDVGYAHIFLEESELENTIPIAATAAGPVFDTLRGEFNDSSADLVGVQLQYRF